MRVRSSKPLSVAASIAMVAIAAAMAGFATGARAVTDPYRTVVHGGAIAQVTLVRNGNGISTSSTSFERLAGAGTAITIPAGEQGILIARFTAGSACIDQTHPTLVAGCFMKILIGGVEGQPSGVNIYSFDSSSDDGTEAHSMEQSRGPLGPGTYPVVVEWATAASEITFGLANWTLEVDRVKV